MTDLAYIRSLPAEKLAELLCRPIRACLFCKYDKTNDHDGCHLNGCIKGITEWLTEKRSDNDDK